MLSSTAFENILKPFIINGGFILHENEKLTKIVGTSNVPDKLGGVYLIYGSKNGQDKTLVYIGKAGTITQKGQLKRQRIAGRLKALRTNNIKANAYFLKKMKKDEYTTLEFKWAATFDEETGNNNVIPAKIEADLIHAYYNIHHCLPPWNEAF